MGLEQVVSFKGYAVDYSFLCEYADSVCFDDFINLISNGSKEIYISRNFKLFHYCYTHQVDNNNVAISNAMRKFVSATLPHKTLHELQTPNAMSFVHEVSKLEDVCLITAKNGILFKRMREKRLVFAFPVLLFDGDDFFFYENGRECYANVPEEEVSPLASRKEYLDSQNFCNVGDVVTTDTNEKLELTKRISNGAEGMVFFTDNPKYVAKIYHRGVITPLRWAKLTKMVKKGIVSPEICWPQNLIYLYGVPVGYTMLIGKGSTLGNVFDGPDAIFNNFPNWTRLEIVETAINIVEKYIYLHLHDIYVGDIQLKNALIKSEKEVYLIDMDSCQIGNLPCPVGTEEFTSPVLWGKDFSTFMRTPANEDYCIAMLVFSILFCGLHPYATRLGKETLREEIIERNFPYTLDNSDTTHIPVGGYNYIWEYLPDTLRRMLYDVFALGRTHEAVEWYDALLEYKKKVLDKSLTDWEAYKVFPKMDYGPTVDKEIEKRDTVKSPFTKGSIRDSVIYANKDNPFAKAAGVSDSNSSYSNNEKKPSSAYVPKMTQSSYTINTANTATKNNVKNDTQADKKKKGLFSKIFNNED